ncbi:2'-5' RNA ligase family protein [Streptomyces sp. NPDC059892]|uniref:2'-5' RNA ligase family protein n=1 Tax=Streptomyces sp. NPDC059892 TaxID=3346989 RepID=UPI00365D425F
MIAAHDWASFGTVREMTNHWDRPGWTDTTRAYYWMLTFPDTPPLIEHARRCQLALQRLGFDNIDERGLHITLGRIGAVHETAATDLDDLMASLYEVRPEAFTLRAVPLTASRGAIRYSVAPWKPIVELHAALSTAGAAVGLPPRRPTSSLRPHLGIAYCNRSMRAGVVREAVRPLRDLDGVDIRVPGVQLVELRREARAYRWEVIHTVELR